MGSICKYVSAILIFVFATAGFSCRKKEKKQVCTTEFKSITVSVQDSSGKKVNPESYDSMILATGEDVTYKGMDDSTAVVVVTDMHQSKFDKNGETVRLTLVVDSRPLWRDYRIASDGCHVELLEGDRVIIVD